MSFNHCRAFNLSAYKHFLHVTITYTSNTKQIALSVDAGGITVREKAKMKIKITSVISRCLV